MAETEEGESKSARKKRLKHEYALAKRKEKRPDEHRRRVAKKKMELSMAHLTLADALPHPTPSSSGVSESCEGELRQRLCLDLRFNGEMSAKELGRLISQLGRVWGCVKGCRNTPDVYVSGLEDGCHFYTECRRRHSGFDKFGWSRRGESVEELFPDSEIVYLSPEATTPLWTLQKEKVYVVCGVVDETPKKAVSLSVAEGLGVERVRLPIAECMRRREGVGSGKLALSLNQVFQILTGVVDGYSWKEVLSRSVPPRTGYAVVSCDENS